MSNLPETDKDVANYNQDNDGTSLRKVCRVLLGQAFIFLILILPVIAGANWLDSRVTSAITNSPEGIWTPVVNPLSTSVGAYVPAMYASELPNGDRCYALIGIVVDQISCVAGPK